MIRTTTTEISTVHKLCLLLVIILVGILAAIGLLTVAERVVPDDHVVPANIKAKMKYHGIEVCFEDWNGNIYFVRDGQKVRL
jgi:hypothetical protein